MNRGYLILAGTFALLAPTFGQWVVQRSGVSVGLTDVTALDSVAAIAVGHGGTILRTTDAGQVWTSKESGTTNDLKAVSVYGAHGYAVGNGVVCETTDEGETWKASAVSEDFVAVSCGGYPLWPAIFMGTAGGKIRYSYDNGVSWKEEQLSGGGPVVSIANIPGPLQGTLTILANQVFSFRTMNPPKWDSTVLATGFWDYVVRGDLGNPIWYLVGGGGNPGMFPFVLRKISSDTVWRRLATNLPSPMILTDAAAFRDTSIVYVCASGGRIFRSDDNGETWLAQISGTMKWLNGLAFHNANRGYAVGDSGVILFTSNGGVTTVRSGGERVPVCTLFQNYPNPFNPVTHLQFSIADLQFVSLKIYDVPGRELATLVDERKEAGTYTVEWNGDRFPGGVYFCVLRAGAFREVMRMVLLR